MTDYSDLLRAEIFSVLDGDAPLQTELGGAGRIHSDVPSKAPYPRIVIGGEDEFAWRTHDKSGGEVTVPIRVWDRSDSWTKVNAIRADVLRLLGDVDLTIAGFDVVGGYFDGATKVDSPEENTKLQILEIRYNVLES